MGTQMPTDPLSRTPRPPPDLSPDSKPRLLRGAIVALALWGPIYSAVLFHQGLRLQGVSVLAGTAVLVLAWWLQRARRSTTLAGNLVAGSLFVVATALALEAEGILSPALNWYVLVPMLATVLVDRWSGVAWGTAGASAIVVLFLVDAPVPRLPAETLEVLAVWGQAGLVLFGLSFAILFDTFRRRAIAALEAKNQDLADALDEVRRLQGILPICMHCRKVRDEHSVWQALEEYLADRAEVHFSHGLCEECLRERYPAVGSAAGGPRGGP